MDYLKKKKINALKTSVNFSFIDIYNLNIEVVKLVYKSLFEYFLIMASIHLISWLYIQLLYHFFIYNKSHFYYLKMITKISNIIIQIYKSQ